MSWSALLALIVEEAGPELAARIEARARREMGGMRLTVMQKPALTVAQIDAVAPGRPKEAAKAFGVHPVTIYRALKRGRIVR